MRFLALQFFACLLLIQAATAQNGLESGLPLPVLRDSVLEAFPSK